jgi:antitoxin (DNA-binding transcriptional repressor) of toxin-antitoxin stability system
MKTVGIRELKNRLSEYLRAVRRGESVLVTDRGEVVAEFSPPRNGAIEPRVPAALLAMSKKGLVTLGRPGDYVLYKPMPRSRHGSPIAAKLLDEERGPG